MKAYIPNETVAAIATAPGDAGVAIVRISGKDAFEVAAKVIAGPLTLWKSHTAHFCQVKTLLGEKIDDALVLLMRAPRTFTGEDTVEIQCHGGRLIAKKILEELIKAGSRAALPGEFSFKAFMNKKIDLAQAEAIQTLVGAKNEKAYLAAKEQLDGKLSKKISDFQKRLTHWAAILEAWVDFPEEELEFASFEEIEEGLLSIAKDIKKLLDTFETGKIIHEGINLAIVGSPNVGKSSLMNALLGRDRAIVSPIAGTTRDLVEDDLKLNGLHFRLVDTAGLRKTEELIEGAGIEKTRQAIERADLFLFIVDATCPHIEEEFLTLLPKGKTIVCWNKVDLEHPRPLPSLPFEHTMEVSALLGTGLEKLHEKIDEVIWKEGACSTEEVVITAVRHRESLLRAFMRIGEVVEGLKTGKSAEFVTFDLRSALLELGTIIGTDVTEDILTEIFSHFCIGK
jgi:tRNA modification GTPase